MNHEPRGVWTQQWPTGSAYIGTNPDVQPQDLDYLEYVRPVDHCQRVAQLLIDGWEQCGLGYTKQDEGQWCAYRRGDWNLILCWCPMVYLRWVAFTELARRCTFVNKLERIELCKALLEGNKEAAQNIVHYPQFNTVASNLMQEWCDSHEGIL